MKIFVSKIHFLYLYCHNVTCAGLISHLELSLEHDLAAVGDDVAALPARDALLQLAQLVQTLLPGLAAGPVPGAEALSVEFFNFVIAVIYSISSRLIIRQSTVCLPKHTWCHGIRKKDFLHVASILKSIIIL